MPHSSEVQHSSYAIRLEGWSEPIMKADKKCDKEVRLNYICIHLIYVSIFHLPQVIDMLQPRQEHPRLQRSRHSLIHLLYFM